MKPEHDEHVFDHSGSREYRDEMNFAEFPLALLNRASENQKTIEFSNTITDYVRKIPVVRKLTISASDRTTLPTPRDEEVILGLIQLSHLTNFASREVHFSKGELVKLLGWSDDGKSYQRITESLKKWASLTLNWENWWSKEEGAFVDKTFHILDNVDILNREKYSERVRTVGTKDSKAGLSSFAWNSVVFSSFKSGYIKGLDLHFYRSLGTPISKKIFRFLDKRFYRVRKLEFDLQTFAFEHTGMSRNYHSGEIKRVLRPAILELEEKGFLEPLSDAERFVRECRGTWKIVFIRKSGGEASIAKETNLGTELSNRGVTRKIAEELVRSYSEEKIRDAIKLHDTLTSNNDKRASKNPAGFLVTAIRDDFALAIKRSQPLSQGKKPNAVPRLERLTGEGKKDVERRKLSEAFSIWWSERTAQEQAQFEETAVKSANAFSVRQYEAGKGSNGALFKAVRTSILLSYFEELQAQEKHFAIPN